MMMLVFFDVMMLLMMTQPERSGSHEEPHKDAVLNCGLMRIGASDGGY